MKRLSSYHIEQLDWYKKKSFAKISHGSHVSRRYAYHIRNSPVQAVADVFRDVMAKLNGDYE